MRAGARDNQTASRSRHRGADAGDEPRSEPRQIRVLLVDGQRLFREGLCALLEKSSKLRVIGQASTTSEAIAKALAAKPDAVVTAFSLPGEEHAALVRELRKVCPDIHVVVLTGHDPEEALSQSLQAGAEGFVLMDATPDLVEKAVVAACSGEIWVQREAMRYALGSFHARTEGPPRGPTLSPRELEVLRLLAAGASTREIAETLFISQSTVRVHLASLCRKLEVPNRILAVRKALLEHLVSLSAIGLLLSLA